MVSYVHFPLQDNREVQEGLDEVVGEQTYTACVSLCNALILGVFV